MTIDCFKDDYAFLSNFYPAIVIFDGITYPSVENAFQAAKTLHLKEREPFLYYTPGQAKRAGRKVSLRTDWENVKVDIMRNLVYDKFKNNVNLKNKLLELKDCELIEGNTWNDTFWGVCRGEGKNMLGKILMEVRDILLSGNK